MTHDDVTSAHADSKWLQSPHLARQILWPLLGQFAGQEACGLTDLDHVAVKIAHITADLGISIDRRRNKLCPRSLHSLSQASMSATRRFKKIDVVSSGS